MPLPVDSSHLSNHDLLLERFDGMVQKQFLKSSPILPFFDKSFVRGTDTISQRRLGGTEIIGLTPGVRPDAQSRALGKVALTIDTVALARDNQGILNKAQEDFNVLEEVAEDHGKTVAKFMEQAFLIQAIKGAQQAAPTAQGAFGGPTQAERDANLQLNFKAGVQATLNAPGDELDPDELFDAIDALVIEFKNRDIEPEDMLIALPPEQRSVLLKNDRLTSADFSPRNANVAARKIHTVSDVPILETARIPQQPITNHPLSNSSNTNAYDVTAADAKATAVLMHPRGLLSGEAIPLKSKNWYNHEELQWFLDTYVAFGVTPARPDLCGAVFKA